ncbi:hypothetical protein GCM10010360_12890 [Streptomyces nogalater]
MPWSVQGFGTSALVHIARLLSLSEDLPMAIVIVDTEERVPDFLPRLDELVGEGLVIHDDCEATRCGGRERE